MRITRLTAHAVELPIRGEGYRISGGRLYHAIHSTILRVDTDEGVTGWGESCPFGSNVTPGFAGGVRAGLAELAPVLLGQDPRRTDVLARLMDVTLAGHAYVKSAVDMACLDILGKWQGRPLHEVLGGRFEGVPEIHGIVHGPDTETMLAMVAAYRRQGYTRFKLKLSGDPDRDIEALRAVDAALECGESMSADANRGWTLQEALRVVRAARDLDFLLEQPCHDYEACRALRRRTDIPIMLDEVIDGMHALLRALAEDAADAVNFKIAKVGGLTRARRMRDVCAEVGMEMGIEDIGGSDISNAAMAHLAQATPAKLRRPCLEWNTLVSRRTVEGGARIEAGRMAPPEGAGLGIVPREDALFDVVFDTSAAQAGAA
ncbi:mandelate racemase/muconate lactonizing enzyme family protein [Rhodosalinus sp. K401]|uniref:mandelate racemase/muconate lactonizing enzyme family protein n=1 Tax=Rhodosalinus sp. K401 TaxID=3239195 RepID=UPI0035258F49